METSTNIKKVERLTRAQVELRIQNCPRLPSLSSINSTLRELLYADQRYSSQIAEVIRRDPSLTARLLRLVNSVYYGLTTPVNSIEEAVFYLGVRQIRQLAMVTPVIENFQKMAGSTAYPWREFWQHCIGTAILTREVINNIMTPNDEADYVAGLVHDVGKIIMAAAFPEHFDAIHHAAPGHAGELVSLEKEILGMDHAELGALYLEKHNLPEIMVEVARYHHTPERASHHAQIVGAVQVADMLMRQAKIGYSDNSAVVSEDDWVNAMGWKVLFPHDREEEKSIARASLKRSLERLPTILEGLV